MKIEDIEIKQVVTRSDDVGWRNYEFSWQGQKCRSETLNGPIAKRRKALEMIRSDLHLCLEYLGYVEELAKNELSSALYKVFVVTYGKCFVSGKERGLSLCDSSVFENADEKILKAHKGLMDLRHKFVAHSDCLDTHDSEVCIIYPPDSQKSLKPYIMAVTLEYGHPTGDSIKSHYMAVNHLIKCVGEMIDKCNDHIVNGKGCLTKPSI